MNQNPEHASTPISVIMGKCRAEGFRESEARDCIDAYEQLDVFIVNHETIMFNNRQ